MRKLLLTTALALLWSFSANAQTLVEKKLELPDCTTSYTVDEALAKTADGNVNTFSATFSNVTTRNCPTLKISDGVKDKIGDQLRPRPRDDDGGCGPNGMWCLR